MTDKYRECLNKGLEYQDFVTEILLKNLGIPLINYSSKKYQLMRGENKQGIEIKLQSGMNKYGELWIETAEKSNSANANYIKSGIYRDDSWLFITGDYDVIYIFAVKTLISLDRSKEKRGYKQKETGTSQAYLLPLYDAEKYCLKKILNRGDA